jgi:hypothetical protein
LNVYVMITSSPGREEEFQNFGCTLTPKRLFRDGTCGRLTLQRVLAAWNIDRCRHQ